MVNTSIRLRPGFTMLELIFALVIIAISILALPTVLFTSTQSQEQTLKEEGILLTTSKIASILTYSWDSNSSPLGTLMSTSQVLRVTNGDSELDRNATSDFRLGHFQEELRRRLTPASNERNATLLPAAPATNKFGIEDFNNEVSDIGAVGSAEGYKKQYRRSTSVIYVDDAATYNATTINYNFPVVSVSGVSPSGGPPTTNIKMIQVSTLESDGAGGWTPIIVMRSYSTNIGEVEFFKRRYE